MTNKCFFATKQTNSPLVTLFHATLFFAVCAISLYTYKAFAIEQPNNQKTCAFTSSLSTAPEFLSETCLYQVVKANQKQRFSISPQLHKFTPNYQLWTDGANKSRWIYLPPNSQINTENPDQWIFPVGTQIFKEFRQFTNEIHQEIKVETRHLQKIIPGDGVDSWLLSTYQWYSDQSDAKRIKMGATDVLNTDHDIPSEQDCVDCHKGNKDLVLGFDAIQLSDRLHKYAFGFGTTRSKAELSLARIIDQQWLTHSLDIPTLPGDPLEKKVLGYLHANCGHCHNPLGLANEQDAGHLKLRHQLAYGELAQTDVYKTAVNQKTQNFTAVPYIILGAEDEELALYQSAMFLRLNSKDENYRMPLLGREKVDYQALDLIHDWMLTLNTPTNVNFNKGHEKKKDVVKTAQSSEQVYYLSTKGLQIKVKFFDDQHIPPVLATYWPEDNSLSNQPVMNHKDGYFTEKLILGRQGSTMHLLNSDDVGHTIYVKDKSQEVNWQLTYMAPGSAFEQDIFWQEDTFVEMKCRLHLYMSSWVGSINSQYYKIVEIDENRTHQVAQMQGYPEAFNQVKIWLPKYELIETEIGIGQEQRFSLKKSSEVFGELTIKRFSQH